MAYVIRPMIRQDIKSVQEVAKASWHATYEGIIPLDVQDNFLQAAYGDEMMERRMKHSYMFVAEMNGDVVGFANFSKVDDEGKAELSAIYLLPAAQGNGIGTALLNEGIQTLKEVRTIYLDVEKDNKAGLHFYQAKGFQVVKEYDDIFDGHVLKTIQMSLQV